MCPHSGGPCRGKKLCSEARLESSETADPTCTEAQAVEDTRTAQDRIAALERQLQEQETGLAEQLQGDVE